MFCYAQIDEKNICVGISQLSGEALAENMILLASCNASLLGKKYNDGIWEEVPAEAEPEVALSEIEKAILQTAINTEYMATMLEATI